MSAPRPCGLLLGASRAFAARAAGAALAFGVGLVVTRTLGPAGAGVFFLAVTLSSIAAVVGRLGLDQLLVRRVAAALERKDHGRLQAAARCGPRLALFGSTAAAGALFAAAPMVEARLFPLEGLATALRCAAFAVPPLALMVLHGELLRGLARVGTSQLVQFPMPAAGTLLVLALAFPAFGASPASAAGAYAGGAALAALVAVALWRRAMPRPAGPAPKGGLFELARAALPFLGVSVLALMLSWISTCALALRGDEADVGRFSVAYRTAALSSFVLIAVSSAAAPRFAALAARGDLPALAHAARRATLLTTACALPIVSLAWIFPERIMGLFGPGFASGGRALAILAAGQAVNVMTGSVGELLLMSGHEGALRRNLFSSVALSLALHAWLVPRAGLEGAAMANAITLGALNLGALLLVRRNLAIDVLPLPRLPLLRRPDA